MQSFFSPLQVNWFQTKLVNQRPDLPLPHHHDALGACRAQVKALLRTLLSAMASVMGCHTDELHSNAGIRQRQAVDTLAATLDIYTLSAQRITDRSKGKVTAEDQYESKVSETSHVGWSTKLHWFHL